MFELLSLQAKIGCLSYRYVVVLYGNIMMRKKIPLSSSSMIGHLVDITIKVITLKVGRDDPSKCKSWKVLVTGVPTFTQYHN